MMHMKMREPGKIHHMRDIRWEGTWHGVARAYTWDFYWEKHHRKTVGSSKLESPGTGMAKMVSILAIVTFCML